MADVDVDALRKLIDEAITQWAAGASPDVASPANELSEVKDERPKPEGKRVVRTKSSGDRVYVLDETAKTRSWVTSPEVLAALGFQPGDVEEVDDAKLLSYQMAAATYRVDGA